MPAGSFPSPPPPDWLARPLRRSSPNRIWLLKVEPRDHGSVVSGRLHVCQGCGVGSDALDPLPTQRGAKIVEGRWSEFLGSARTSCTPTRSGPALVISSAICCSLRAYRSLTACSALVAGRSRFSRFQVMTETMLATSPCRDGGRCKRCIHPKPI
jgi:hypothetical protein